MALLAAFLPAYAAPSRPMLSTAENEELKRLRAELGQLWRANEILKAASALFARELDRPRTKS